MDKLQKQQIFIEAYRYREKWLNLPQQERDAYVDAVSQAIANMEAQGVQVIAFGFNAPQTDRRAPYDCF